MTRILKPVSEKMKCKLEDPKRSSEQHEDRNLRIQCLEKKSQVQDKSMRTRQ